MSRAPQPQQYARRALSKDLRDRFDARARENQEGTARELGITIHQVNALMYGGKARADVVERVEAVLRKDGASCR